MIRSIALAVTWRGDRSSRLRSAVLAVAAMVVTLVVLAAASASFVSERVYDRTLDRTFVTAGLNDSVDISSALQYDSIDGEAIVVIFWRVKTPGVTIPGIPANPEDDEWFVSPELARRIEIEPVLEGRFENASIIGDAGVGNGGELLAYRFVGPDFPLYQQFVDERATERFGAEDQIPSSVIVIAASGLVLIIGVGFLRAALGPATVGLGRRLRMLHVLGATRFSIARFIALSTTLVTLPASMFAAIGWYFLAPTLTTVPYVGEVTLRGDLRIPLWLAALTALVVPVLAGILGLRLLGSRIGSRPTSQVPHLPGLWRILPLAGSLGIIVYATFKTGETAVEFLLIGILAAAFSVTFALPILIDRLGAMIARGRSPLSLLVGRRLSWNAATSSRSLIALAGVAVIVPVAGSFIAADNVNAVLPGSDVIEVFTINGNFDRAGLGMLEENAGGVVVDVYRDIPLGDNAPIHVWVADCERIRGKIPLERCGPDGIVVEQEVAIALNNLQLGDGVLKPPEGYIPQSRVFLTSDGPRAERVLRAFALNADNPELSITSLEDQRPKEDRIERWFFSGIQLAGIGAFAALLLSVVTAAAQSARTRSRLFAIGAEFSMVRRLAAAESFLVVALVGLGGTAVGTVGAVAYALINEYVEPNYWPSSIIACAVLAAATLSGVTAAAQITATSARTALGNPE